MLSPPDDKPTILKPVFFPAAGLIGLVVLITIAVPGAMESLFTAVESRLVDGAGWLYMLSVGLYLAFCIFLAGSRFGQTRLGPDHSTPDYGYISWFAMLFSAGMGIGLLFFSVGEPLIHYAEPPAAEAQSLAAARQAMTISFFHWGVHAWAIYGVMGMALAYFGFRHGLPLTVRSTLYPLLGDRIHGPIGHTIDVVAVVSTLFGVATSLGYGVSQVNAGLSYLFDLPFGTTTQSILIALITACATVSVVAGLDRGIKRLSELNLILALVLLAFVFLLGPTLVLLNLFVENIGLYLQAFFRQTFGMRAYSDRAEWMGDWTLFYWGWWISWSPFVGMFIARVSRGRTIREFVIGVLLVPPLFTFFWFTVFGNSALLLSISGEAADIAKAVSDNLPVALFRFLEHLPLSSITSLVAVLLVMTFFVTSSDSGSLVIDTIAAGGTTDAPVWQRVFWAVLEGAVAATLLYAGGLAALQTATLAAALPFTLILFSAAYGLYRGLQMEGLRRSGAEQAPEIPIHGDEITWQAKLKAVIATPRLEATQDFLSDTIHPALEKVAGELRGFGYEAEVQATDTEVALQVPATQDMADFEYGVHIRKRLRPRFSLAATKETKDRTKDTFRAEVHLLSGGQNYCVFGYTEAQIINDVLRQFNQHVHFLRLAQS